MNEPSVSSGETVYWHGGAPGLRVGSHVLPPVVTKAASLGDYYARGIARRDRVYVTTSYDAACMYAAMHPSDAGKVYKVQPQGEIEPDPDCTQDCLSFACHHATVLAVHRLRGKLRMQIRKAMVSA